jgi:tetratricopeptide (TPR) repeat protein
VIDRLQVEAANGRRADPKNFVPVMSLQGEHLTAGGNPEAAVELLESAAVWSEGQGRVSRTERSLLIERLGQAYLEAGRFDEASERFQAIRSDVESQFGPESEAMALAQIDIARLQDRQGHSDAAEDTWRWAIDIQAQKAPTSTQLARMRHEFALFLLRQGRDLEAAEQASSAAAVVAKRRSQVRLYATCLYTVATASALTQDDERAEESMRAAITALEQTGSSGRSLRIEIMRAYVRFLRERGRNDEADAGDAWLAAELGEVAPAATDEPPAD